jgi:hypothetical protein
MIQICFHMKQQGRGLIGPGKLMNIRGLFASATYVRPVPHVYQSPAFMFNHSAELDSRLKAADSSFTFVGLEPSNQEFRRARLETSWIPVSLNLAQEGCRQKRFIHD